ncbi:MAG: hypothetical protein ACF8NJ_09730 [Phycisphaerales bacterium JB038]
MSALVETIGGVYELARLGVLSRFRFKGRYWQWRLETAFGRGFPRRWELLVSTLEYGRWCYRMRRMH